MGASVKPSALGRNHNGNGGGVVAAAKAVEEFPGVGPALHKGYVFVQQVAARFAAVHRKLHSDLGVGCFIPLH
jgi:hypothetical protein